MGRPVVVQRGGDEPDSLRSRRREDGFAQGRLERGGALRAPGVFEPGRRGGEGGLDEAVKEPGQPARVALPAESSDAGLESGEQAVGRTERRVLKEHGASLVLPRAPEIDVHPARRERVYHLVERPEVEALLHHLERALAALELLVVGPRDVGDLLEPPEIVGEPGGARKVDGREHVERPRSTRAGPGSEILDRQRVRGRHRSRRLEERLVIDMVEALPEQAVVNGEALRLHRGSMLFAGRRAHKGGRVRRWSHA